ncbi:MAG: hypothetical protein ACQES0_00035 [Bacteroidota bacterium]
MKSPKVLIVVLLTLMFHGGAVFSQANQKDSLAYSDFVRNDLEKTESSFKNTSISLRLPKHFKEFSNEDINGYMHTGTASSIVGYEMEQTPYALSSDSLTQEQLSGQGVKLVGQEESKTYEGMPAKFYFVEFKTKDVEVIRIMFFTGSYNKTVFLQANYPKGFDSLLRKVIMESFRTVKFQ